MTTSIHRKRNTGLAAVVVLLLAHAGQATAVVQGVTDPGNTFNLTARAGIINTPDGDSFLVWGYAIGDQVMQYPGPTLIVNQGASVTVTLKSELTAGADPVPVSIVFPGQQGVMATGGSPGLLVNESSGPADTVTYTFTANNPGTYLYQSGTQQQLQIEMGLVGTLIVRPGAAGQAYNHADTAFDHEYLLFLTEMDPRVHYAVGAATSLSALDAIDNTQYHPVLWFINGRNAPDTMAPANAAWLPHQPYDALPRVHAGDIALLRFVNAGRDLHPFHTHGNHLRLLARDGRMLSSAPGAGVDLSTEDFTLKAVTGATYDALWNWTGEKLGWDVFGTNEDLSPEDPYYNHVCADNNGDGFDDATREYCADHDKSFPVVLPSLSDLTFGGFYSGSPFLGAFASLPPGEGGLNLNAGMFFMWHSHTEKEIINNDIFPGGMMTMVIVETPHVPIP